MADITSRNVWASLDKKEPKAATDSAYDAWRESKDSPQQRATLLEALKPTVESALTTYAGDNKDIVRTPAYMMAYDAVKRFDPAKGAKLKTYVFGHLQSLRRVSAERSGITHVPEAVRLDQNALYKTRQIMEDELGREPTALELADRTGISPRRMERLAASNKEMSESQALNEKGDSLFAQSGDPRKIWAEYVYNDLDDRDKKIFEWSTGFGGSATHKKIDIAKKLGISPAAVSKRVSRIIGKLEEGNSL